LVGPNETIIIKQNNAPDITVELAKYLDVLGSPIRLNILKLLGTTPMDVELVCRGLWRKYHISSCRENTKKHIDKLLSIGLVRKKAGIRDNRAVINYVLVSGSIETAMRTLSKVMRFDLDFQVDRKVAGVREKLSEKFSDSFAVIRVLGGVYDGREFLLKENEAKIGRADPDKADKYDTETDIVLADQYKAVTRVWKPHARLFLEGGQWYIEHCKGRNLTCLWNKELEENKKHELKDGDIINIARGSKGVRLVFLWPKLEKQVQEEQE
jgi:hypothetical protein